MGMVYPIPTTGWYGYHWYYQISLLHRSQMIRNDPKFGWSNTNTSNLDEVLFPSCSIQHDPYPYIYIFHPHHIQVKTCLNMGTTTDIPTYSDFKRDTSEHFWCFFVGFVQEKIWQSPILHNFSIFLWHMISHDFTWFHVAQKTTAKTKVTEESLPWPRRERHAHPKVGMSFFSNFKDSKQWHPVSMKFISWMCIYWICWNILLRYMEVSEVMGVPPVIIHL